MSSEVAVSLEIAQHGPKRCLALLSQVFEISDPDPSISTTRTTQDIERGLVLSFVKREVETRNVVVQMSSAAGACQPVRKAFRDQVSRDVPGVALAGIAKSRKEELHVVRDGIAQQIQDLRNRFFSEVEIVVAPKFVQKCDGRGLVPRVQSERREVVDGA